MPLVFDGYDLLRERVILSILTGKSIKIQNIRNDEENPGLKDYEISFLKLCQKITEGSSLEINYTGTSFFLKPGIIKGGIIEHNCDLLQPIGYYLEYLIFIAPFSKNAFKLTLKGITTSSHKEQQNQDQKKVLSYPSVDIIRTVFINSLKHYDLTGEIIQLAHLKVLKRGSYPLGGGECYFECPIIKNGTKVMNLTDEGKILKIRGVSSTTRVSPQIANRLVESARSVLNQFIPDIYISTDVFKGPESGNSPGYHLCLVAESTTGCFYFAEQCGESNAIPEDIGINVAKELLAKIQYGGAFDLDMQSIALLIMALGTEDIYKIKLGKIARQTSRFIDDLHQFFGINYKIKNNKDEDGSITMSCIGTGFVNFGKKIQ